MEGRGIHPLPGRMGRRTVPSSERRALVSTAVAGNPRAIATRLHATGGVRPRLGGASLEAGASRGAAYAFDRGPRRRAPLTAPRASLGDPIVSARGHQLGERAGAA